MSLIEYDFYFAGKSFFEVFCNNSLAIKYGLELSYSYKIFNKNDVFYCCGIKNNSFFYLGEIDYFSSNLILPNGKVCAKYKKELMVIEKLLHHSKEEDFVLLENSFSVYPLNCFYCGKKTINPNYPIGADCEKYYGRYSTRSD